MRTQRFVVVGVVIALVIAGGILPGAAQLPLAPESASGLVDSLIACSPTASPSPSPSAPGTP